MTHEVVMTRVLKVQQKGKQGFASMSLERRREIASMGGRSIPDANRTFFKERDLAREAVGRVASPAAAIGVRCQLLSGYALPKKAGHSRSPAG